jgi:hypothetical protein
MLLTVSCRYSKCTHKRKLVSAKITLNNASQRCHIPECYHIQYAKKCNHWGPYKSEAEGDLTTREKGCGHRSSDWRDVLWRWRKEPYAEGFRRPLEDGKDKEMHSLPRISHPVYTLPLANEIGFRLSFFQTGELNLGPHTFEAGTLSFELQLQSFLLWLFLRKGLTVCPGWPGLWSPYLCFPIIWDDRCMSLRPAMGWDGFSWIFCSGCLLSC